MNNLPALRAYRGNVCENVHFASTVVCSKTGKVERMFPDSSDMYFYLRSSAKPFQAFPLYQNPESKHITQEEWAIICASHSASQNHLTMVQKVLDRSGSTVDDLQCGPHPPMDESMAKVLLCSDASPTRIHNNCSGKHAGMLLACHYYGWPKETYLELEHPLQQAILNTIIQYSGTSDISIAIDGCGAPVFALPMKNSARLFGSLVTEPAFHEIALAMTTFPELVGDPKRIDTQLMKVTNGNLISKVGAESFLGVANFQTGEGLAIKMIDGNNTMRDRLAIAILEDIGWLTSEQAELLWSQPQFTKERRNTQDKIVGYFETSLPWVSCNHVPPVVT
jgi:L-asparaginase II